jgi:hypothetical protein
MVICGHSGCAQGNTLMIKTTLLVLAAVGLTGCAVYPAAPYGAVYEPAPVYGPSPVYMTPAPVFIGGSVNFGHPRGHRHHRHGPRGHRH